MRRFTLTLLAILLPTLALAQEGGISIDTTTQNTPMAEEIQTPTQREDLLQGLEAQKWYPVTGRDLLALIENCEDGSCMSFVAGAISGLATKAFIMGQAHPFCSGDFVQVEDIRNALVKTITENPDMQTMPVPMVIVETFAQTWPCETVDVAQTENEETTETAFGLDSMVSLDPGSIHTILENYPGALTLGNLAAPTVQTLVIFHDPNCQFCADFKSVTDTLADTGWKVVILPVGILGENSTGYSAIMYALSQSRLDVVEAMYRNAKVGEASVETALELAQEAGITAPQILSLVAQTKAYDYVAANESLFELLGVEGTPTWILGDYLYTGIVSVEDIQSVARVMPAPPGDVGFTRPGAESTPTDDALVLPDTPTTETQE